MTLAGDGGFLAGGSLREPRLDFPSTKAPSLSGSWAAACPALAQLFGAYWKNLGTLSD